MSSALSAQGLCNVGGGSFDISPSEGCAPLTVTITNNVSNAITVGYDPTYDGVSNNPSLRDYPAITYYSSGNFTLLQYGAVSSGRYSACKQVKVYETGTPSAQYTSCGGGKIKLVLDDNAVLRIYDQIEIKWGDGSQDEIWKKGDAVNFDHIYTNTAINPVISIKGIYSGNNSCAGGTPLSLPVSFQQPQLNTIQIKTVETKQDGSLELTYAGITAIATEMQFSSDGTNYTTHGTRTVGGSSIFYRMDNLNANQVYQVRLSSKDLCGGQLDSDVVTSTVISGKSEDEKNIISWNKYPVATDFVEYELFRDGVSVKKFSINELSYTDSNVQCGDQFEYYVVAKTKNITSTSARLSVKTEIAQAKPISQASVTVNGDKLILINAVIPGVNATSVYELTVERAEAGSTTFKRIATVSSQNEFVDSDVKANELSYCYRLSYQNACGQKLPATEPICSILLKNELSNFIWTTEKPYLESTASYAVLQKGSSGASAEFDNSLKNSFVPVLNAQSDLEYTFQIRANSTSGNFQSLSNIVYYKRSPGVFVPDAFSPNDDTYNDELLAKTEGTRAFNFFVLTRWGEVIFHSEDILVGWDGKIKGQNAPVGSYVYKVSFIDDINQKVEKSGTFMLLR